MANVKKGLGRGLSALIPEEDMSFLTKVARGVDIAPGGAALAATDAAVPHTEVQWLAPTAIQPNPYQPRRTFNPTELQELAASIKLHGILQPVLVRPINPGDPAAGYQLVAGERRWRAAQQAGLATIPAVVRAVGDQQALELALIENVQRHDISPLDAAIAYRRLAHEFQLSQEEIAQRVGKSRSAVANTMRLLELPDEVQKSIEDGTLSEGHGRAILQAPDTSAQRAILSRVLRDGLSVREAENLARTAALTEAAQPGPARGYQKPDSAGVELHRLEKRLERTLGAPTAIKARGAGGQVVIQYFSPEDLERLLDQLLGR